MQNMPVFRHNVVRSVPQNYLLPENAWDTLVPGPKCPETFRSWNQNVRTLRTHIFGSERVQSVLGLKCPGSKASCKHGRQAQYGATWVVERLLAGNNSHCFFAATGPHCWLSVRTFIKNSNTHQKGCLREVASV